MHKKIGQWNHSTVTHNWQTLLADKIGQLYQLSDILLKTDFHAMKQTFLSTSSGSVLRTCSWMRKKANDGSLATICIFSDNFSLTTAQKHTEIVIRNQSSQSMINDIHLQNNQKKQHQLQCEVMQNKLLVLTCRTQQLYTKQWQSMCTNP